MRHFLVLKFFVREKTKAITSMNCFVETNIISIARENISVVNRSSLCIAGINNTCRFASKKLPQPSDWPCTGKRISSQTPQETEQCYVLFRLPKILHQNKPCSGRHAGHSYTTVSWQIRAAQRLPGPTKTIVQHEFLQMLNKLKPI